MAKCVAFQINCKLIIFQLCVGYTITSVGNGFVVLVQEVHASDWAHMSVLEATVVDQDVVLQLIWQQHKGTKGTADYFQYPHTKPLSIRKNQKGHFSVPTHRKAGKELVSIIPNKSSTLCTFGVNVDAHRSAMDIDETLVGLCFFVFADLLHN